MTVDCTEASHHGMQERHNQRPSNAPPQLLIVGMHHPNLHSKVQSPVCFMQVS